MLLVGCGGGDDSLEVSRNGLVDPWPLTVDEGTVRCENGSVGLPIFVGPDGTEYGLTGQAVAEGYADIDSIWADDADTGFKVNLGSLTAVARALC